MKKRYLVPFILLTPLLALAQQPTDFRSFVGLVTNLISLIIPLIFALTLVVLIWGITKAWIINAGDEAEIERGKKLVTVGIIVLVIMSGIWGILAILRSSFFG